jgi:hypothetical protein
VAAAEAGAASFSMFLTMLCWAADMNGGRSARAAAPASSRTSSWSSVVSMVAGAAAVIKPVFRKRNGFGFALRVRNPASFSLCQERLCAQSAEILSRCAIEHEVATNPGAEAG